MVEAKRTLKVSISHVNWLTNDTNKSMGKRDRERRHDALRDSNDNSSDGGRPRRRKDEKNKHKKTDKKPKKASHKKRARHDRDDSRHAPQPDYKVRVCVRLTD